MSDLMLGSGNTAILKMICVQACLKQGKKECLAEGE